MCPRPSGYCVPQPGLQPWTPDFPSCPGTQATAFLSADKRSIIRVFGWRNRLGSHQPSESKAAFVLLPG